MHALQLEPTTEMVAYAAIIPFFDAVKERFARFSPEPGRRLRRVDKTALVVDGAVHDSPRHYAGCREDGRVIVVAPQASVELPMEVLLAILCHEFGHAADFLYPAQWRWHKGQPAEWRPEPTKLARWSARSPDQVEWAADSIAQAVTGQSIGYCGSCVIQCFDAAGVRPRPEGLR